MQDKIIHLTGYPVDRIIRLPWGVDLTQFHPAPSRLNLRDDLGWNDNKIIISTRSFEPIYGINIFLRAAVSVIEKAPEARFLMLGDGSLRPEVEKFIIEQNMGQIIHLTGRVRHDLLPDYFNEAYLYVSSSYSDGTSVSLLEAMACELPVVVTDLAANREWISQNINGWLVPVGDTQTLSSAMFEALEHMDKVRTMAKANLAVAREKADWNNNFTILLKAYERAIGEDN
ncbi:glycosyltransferase [Chloroflexota bacterium]